MLLADLPTPGALPSAPRWSPTTSPGARSEVRDEGSRYPTQWSGPPIVLVGELHHGNVKVLWPRRSRRERRRLRRRNRPQIGR